MWIPSETSNAFWWWCSDRLGNTNLVVFLMVHRIVNPEIISLKNPERLVVLSSQVGEVDINAAVTALGLL